VALLSLAVQASVRWQPRLEHEVRRFAQPVPAIRRHRGCTRGHRSRVRQVTWLRFRHARDRGSGIQWFAIYIHLQLCEVSSAVAATVSESAFRMQRHATVFVSPSVLVDTRPLSSVACLCWHLLAAGTLYLPNESGPQSEGIPGGS